MLNNAFIQYFCCSYSVSEVYEYTWYELCHRLIDNYVVLEKRESAFNQFRGKVV